MTNRDKQAIETKKRIYNCGVSKMNRHGYDRVTVEQIAREAGVSVGTFYHHFNSKFDLLAEIFRIGDAFFREHFNEIKREHADCRGQVLAYFDLYARLSLQDGIDMVKSLYVPTNSMFVTHGRAMQDLLTGLILNGQSRGEVDASPQASEITESLFLVARGVIFDWCLHDGKTDLNVTMAEIMARQLGSYLRK